jgi:UDP-N-acetylmuramate--alanine ligase
LDEFARAFHQADSVFVLDIYGASVKPIEGVSSKVLVDRIRAFGHRDAHYAGAMDSGIASVIEAVHEGDAIVTLGAGSVSHAGGRILERLRSSVGGTGPERPSTGSVVPQGAPLDSPLDSPKERE